MQAPRLKFAAFLLVLTLALLGSVRIAAAYSVPTSFPFQGYLVDQFGSPVTTGSGAPLPMRFGLFINGTRVWYAAYSGVNITGGSYTVNLGADNSVAQGLNPSTGVALGSTGVTPITPFLLTAVTNHTPVAVQVEISNGMGGYEPPGPMIPVNSALFSLRTETIGGYYEHQLAKQDNNGNILDYNGNPVISSSGTWIGVLGPEQGPQGQPGVSGSNGMNGTNGINGQGFNFAGPWNSENEYNPYDVVTFDGSVFIVPPNGSPDGENPDVDTSDWSLFVPGFSYRGEWGSNVYYANDVVFYNGTEFIATDTVDDTGEDASAPPQDPFDWSVYTQGFNFTGPWNGDNSYNPYDVATFNGSVFIVQPSGSPDGENPDVDTSNWSLLASGFDFMGAWGDQPYYVNDVVLYNGSLYIATDSIDDSGGGTPPPQDTSDWTRYTEGFNPTGAYDSGATYFVGDVVFYNDSSYVCLDDFTSGGNPPNTNSNFTPLATGVKGPAGAPGAQGPAGPPTLAGARWLPLGMTAKVLTPVGGDPFVSVGTLSGTAEADAYYVKFTSAVGVKKFAGAVGPFVQTQSRYHPVLTALIRTGTSITSQRIWVALSSADLSGTDGVGATTTKYVGLRYSTSAGDTDWQIASGDGTTGSVIDSGVPVQGGTPYLIQLNWSVDGQLSVLINDVMCGTKTTNLDTGDTTNLGVDCVSTTLHSTPIAQLISHISLVYDGNDF